MPITTIESSSERKSIDVTITPSATGVSAAGSVRWFDTLYQIPDIAIPCVYDDDETYRVVLASAPPRLLLVGGSAQVPDEVCYLARWAFTAPTDTCESVSIEVPRRVLVDRPPTVVETAVMEPYEVEQENAAGETVTVTRLRHAVDAETGALKYRREVIPAQPLPEPARVTVSPTPVLTIDTPERSHTRKVRRRIRDLTRQAKTLRDSGTTYAAMTAAQRQIIGELVALTGQPVPLAVP